MKKRLLSLTLALVMTLALLPQAAFADGDFQITDSVLTKYTGPGGDVVIPSGVIAIGEEAFESCETLTSVTIPAGVTGIGEKAFRWCKSLTVVTIPTGVTSIGEQAFYACKNLTSVTIPEGVVTIGNGAFGVCGSLTSVTIPESVTSIGNGVFYGCSGLTDVTIPKSVTYIADNMFHGCESLSMTIPDHIISIGQGAFRACYSLTDVTIPEGVIIIGPKAFYACRGITSLTIPNSVTRIWAEGFSECSSLTNVTIPDSVSSLELAVFSGCTSLTSVMIPSSVTSIQEQAFRKCESLTDVYYGGTETQWKAIEIVRGNDCLQSATIHYNSAAPAQIAYASPQPVLVDGSPVEFQCYALKDEKGNPTNYVKLRDVAFVLNGTSAQFNVGWDGAVNIKTGKAYVPNGSEMSTPFSGDRAYQKAAALTNVNGTPSALEAIALTDDRGGQYTYYKLRDLGAALGFQVDWTAEKGIFIETK